MRPSLDSVEFSYLLQLEMVLEKVTPVLSRFLEEARVIGADYEGDLHRQLALPLPDLDELHYWEPSVSHGGLHE